MKKILGILLVLLLALAAMTALADDVTVEVELKYCYDNTESMLTLVNDFRTSDTWYWNSDNETKTEVTGLAGLTYDYGLEKIAMERAAECAIHYAHMRPDGTMCTSIPEVFGENIAAGYRTKEAVFDGWKEENEKYGGQGHRRNMLGSYFTHIGIGCVQADGVYYWVQIFGVAATGESQVKLTSPAKIKASLDVISNEDDANNGELKDVALSADSLKIKEGESAETPAVGAKAGWSGTPIKITGLAWTSSNENVVTMADGKAKGVSGGKAALQTTLGSELKVNVVCVCKEHTWNDGQVTKEATCMATGAKTFTCTKCDETKEEVIPLAAHTLTEVKQVDATCTETGTEAHWACSVCKKLFSDDKAENEITEPKVIAKKPHTLTEVKEVDSTCTETGTEAYWTCSVCKKLFSDDKAENEITEPKVIAKKPHTLAKTEQVDATCDKTGTEAYWTCSVCQKLFSDEKAENEIQAPKTIDQKEHTWDEGVITKEATYSEDGIRLYTCTACGTTREETVSIAIPAGGTGWVQQADGSVAYGDANGNAVIGPAAIDGTLYCFNEQGRMITGWGNLGDDWYYAESSGAAVHGTWKQISGSWYYFREDGRMATGWVQSGETWFYMKADGQMAVGWVEDDGKWYYMNSRGNVTVGWTKINNAWYYFRSNGEMATGWINPGGTWYYMKPSGEMAVGWVEDGGEWYYMAENGMMMTGWLRSGGKYYLLQSSGEMATGWVKYGGWYYFKLTGEMAANEWIEDKEAEKKLPEEEKRELWYWFDENGTMATGWKLINGRWEMFAGDGEWLYSWSGQ